MTRSSASISLSAGRRLARTMTYAVLLLCSAVCITPFLWMVITSFKSNAEAFLFPPTLVPRRWLLSNYVKGWQVADFTRFTINSCVVTAVCTVGTVFSAAFVAYGFAKFRARASGFLYACLLATMMLPTQVTLIPQYLIYYKLGMVDSYWPLFFPAWLGGGAFNVFLYRQFFMAVPKELSEAAEIDGASTFQTFWKILLPSIKPVAISVGVMSLVYNWNDFFSPLIYLNTTAKFTISIGLQFLNSSMVGRIVIGQLMAVSVLATIPVLLIFFVCQKYFVQGIKVTGLKA